jgi:hypothetical protein
MTLVVSAIALKLYDNGKEQMALRVNRVGSRAVISVYVVANIIFIALALT